MIIKSYWVKRIRRGIGIRKVGVTWKFAGKEEIYFFFISGSESTIFFKERRSSE